MTGSLISRAPYARTVSRWTEVPDVIAVEDNAPNFDATKTV